MSNQAGRITQSPNSSPRARIRAKERSFAFKSGVLKVNVDRKLNRLLGELRFKLTSFAFGRLKDCDAVAGGSRLSATTVT